MTTPFLILIDGPMGSGKTTTSKLLSQKLPDAARVALPDIKRLIPNNTESEKDLTITRAVIHTMINTYLEHGVSVIVEQITKKDGVEALRETAVKHGAQFYGYRLTAPEHIRFERVKDRTKEMMGVAELSQSKIDELLGYFEPNKKFYTDNPIDTIEAIDTENLDPQQVVEIILSKAL